MISFTPVLKTIMRGYTGGDSYQLENKTRNHFGSVIDWVVLFRFSASKLNLKNSSKINLTPTFISWGTPSVTNRHLTFNLVTPPPRTPYHCCHCDWSLTVSPAARPASLGECITPPCVPPGLSDVPSTRTNRGGPSGCSSWGRPRECAPLPPRFPSPPQPPTHLTEVVFG